MCPSSVLSFFSQWRLWIRPFLIALYVILIIVLVPILIAHSINNGFKKSDQGTLVGGGFVLLALPISVWQIIQHIVHYTKPSLQKHIIRFVILYFSYLLYFLHGLVKRSLLSDMLDFGHYFILIKIFYILCAIKKYKLMLCNILIASVLFN